MQHGGTLQVELQPSNAASMRFASLQALAQWASSADAVSVIGCRLALLVVVSSIDTRPRHM